MIIDVSDPSATLGYWFRRTAQKVPDAIAIDLGLRQVTYRELDTLVEQCRETLRPLPPKSRVCLLATPELSTYVAYLAIQRQGLIVIPLGPANPVPLHETIAELAEAAAVFVNAEGYAETAEILGRRGLEILSPACTDVDPAALESQPALGTSDDVAYILFTSGSTGTPKGVPITHRNLCAYLAHVIGRYGLQPGDRLSHTFALTFDLSVFDMFASWCSGATLVVPHKRELLAPTAYVRRRKLTHWFSVPSLVSYAQRIGSLSDDDMPNLRLSVFCGEALSQELARAWHRAAPRSRIDNVYGPTELTISCSEYQMPGDEDQWISTENGTVPIGEIYGTLEYLVVGTDGSDSECGELCVRGPQRLTGYLDPNDNNGRFARLQGTSVVPLTADEGLTDQDWYRTGDRVRRTQHGLVHLGRIDRQVKINGYRIELGDIEGVLRLHAAVRDVAVFVVPDEDGEGRIVAAVCGDSLAGAGLTQFVGAQRPAYMIPSKIAWLPSFPLTVSGKTDYSKLQEWMSHWERADQ